jgi:hypothetical protein
MSLTIANNLLASALKPLTYGYHDGQQQQQFGITLKTLKMGSLIWSIFRDVHKPSQITHLKTNGK